MAEPNDTSQPSPSSPPELLGRVGSELRRAFDDAAAEPLPEAFEDLLKQLS